MCGHIFTIFERSPQYLELGERPSRLRRGRGGIRMFVTSLAEQSPADTLKDAHPRYPAAHTQQHRKCLAKSEKSEKSENTYRRSPTFPTFGSDFWSHVTQKSEKSEKRMGVRPLPFLKFLAAEFSGISDFCVTCPVCTEIPKWRKKLQSWPHVKSHCGGWGGRRHHRRRIPPARVRFP